MQNLYVRSPLPNTKRANNVELLSNNISTLKIPELTSQEEVECHCNFNLFFFYR